VILAVGLYPSAVMFASAGLIRDGWIYVLSMAAVTLFAAGLWSGARLRLVPLLLVVAVSWLLTGLRPYAPLSLAAGVGLWMLWEARVPVGRWRMPSRLLGVVGVGVGAAAYFAGRDRLPRQFRSIEAIADYRARYFRLSGSNMGIDFRDVTKPTMAVRYLYSLLGNAVGPLPWQIDTTIMLGFAAEAFALAVCGWCLWRRRHRLGPRARFLVAQAVAWFLIIAIFNDNLGTAARLRVPAWTWLLVALGSVLRWQRAPVLPARARSVLVPLRPSPGPRSGERVGAAAVPVEAAR
jgi:hypothetical protein